MAQVYDERLFCVQERDGKRARLITEQIRQKAKNHAKSVTINAKNCEFISLMEEDENNDSES